MPDECVAIVMTPDAIRDGLAKRILDDLISVMPMRILWQKEWHIVSVDTVFSVYPRLVGRPSCAPVIRTMMSGGCFVTIACGENLYLRLREIKGRIKFNDDFTEVEVTGLRLKYRTWSFEELDLLKERNSDRRQAILNKIYEFRVHTTDNLKETANICSFCMSNGEVVNLKNIAPLLYDEVIRLKRETM